MSHNLPLVRMSAINPFLLELQHRRIDSRPLLQGLGLPAETPASPDLFVAAETIYEIVEKSAKLAKDRFFGYFVGAAVDLSNWEPISDAIAEASTVGELLSKFAIYASSYSNATTFYVITRGNQVRFGFDRLSAPAFTPAQNDAFYIGFMIRLLRQSTNDSWDGSQVLLRVADPTCIPALPKECRVAQGDNSGVEITFPANWLFAEFEKRVFDSSEQNSAINDMPGTMLSSLRSVLSAHLHDSDLTVEKAAKLCRCDRRLLSRELRNQGTTLAREISGLRAERAKRDLIRTDKRIADIGELVGFTDPTVFSRAFKRWTGQSPQQYRRNHKMADAAGEDKQRKKQLK